MTGRHGIIRFVPKRSRAKAWVLLVVVLLVAVVGSVAYLIWRQTVPGVQSLTTAPRFIGQKTAFTVVVEARRGNVAPVEVRIEQSGKSTPVATKDSGLGRRVEIPVLVDSAAIGLREGSATIEVWARDTFWRPIRRDDRAIAGYPVTIDLTPPKVELLAATHYLSPGGSGLVAFRVSGASRTDVTAGAMAFPSFAFGPADKGARIALIALPWDYDAATPIQIRATDEAGNTASRGIPAEIRPRKFPKDTIEIKDAFLQAKIPELLPQRPATDSLVDGFLMINRDLRRQAEETKRKIGASTADKPLLARAVRAGAQHQGVREFCRDAQLRARRQRDRPADPFRVRPGVDATVAGAGLQQGRGRIRRAAHDLRQRGGDRPRARSADALRPSLEHDREGRRRRRERSGDRADRLDRSGDG